MIEQKEIRIHMVSDQEAGMRLDKFASEAEDGISRSYIQKLITKGHVSVSGVVITQKKHQLNAGDMVEIVIPEEETPDIIPQNIPLNIVYEDEDLLIIDKPAGIVVHPAPGNQDGTLVNGIMYHCKDSLSSINGVTRPGIVHRIDKDTSGLLMVAKNDESHRFLAEKLAKHDITRAYKAIVIGNIKEDFGRIETQIGRSSKDRKKMAVLSSGGRHAITNWNVLERFGRYTLVETRLETGRTHQIRVHMAYIKHPLLGDAVYGSAKPSKLAKRQMLHAYLLGFVHPKSGEYMEFISEPPDDFKTCLSKMENV